MRIRRRRVVGSFVLMSACLGSFAHAAYLSNLPQPDIEKFPNGLMIAWFVNDAIPVTDFTILVKSGSRDDPAGKSGTAELLAAALDRGSAGMNAQAMAKSIEELGASRFESAEDDAFSIGVHGLAPDSPKLLEILGKIVMSPNLDPAEIKREHERMLDQLGHIADSGDTLASLAFSRILRASTSYARQGVASLQEFKKVTPEDVAKFYKTHFTPGNSILMVVGRVDRAKTREQLLSIFGKWEGSEPKHAYRSFGGRISASPGEVVVIERPELTQAQVRIGFRAPPLRVPEHYALYVANALLGEYFNSRLNSIIRDKLGLTYSISSAFMYQKDFAEFAISSASKNESVGQLITKTIDILRDLKKKPIPIDEVKEAKEYLVGSYPLTVSTLGAVAGRWLTGYMYDLGPSYLNEFVPKITGVVPDEVSKAVLKDFDLSHLVITVAGDPAKIIPSLRDQHLRFKRVSAGSLL